MFYLYDYCLRKWNVYKTSYIPSVSIFNTEIKRMWCSKHFEWEKIGYSKDGLLYFSCGNPVNKSVVILGKWSNVGIEVIPDINKLSLEIKVKYMMTEFKKFHLLQKNNVCRWKFNMLTGKSDEYLSISNINDIEIPDFVYQRIQAVLSFFSKIIYGKALGNNSKNRSFVFLKNFVSCPACPPFASLKTFFYDESSGFNRKDINIFNTVCNKVYVKPFKKLRKNLYKNPFSFPVYVLLINMGVTDVNAMEKFLNIVIDDSDFISKIRFEKGKVKFVLGNFYVGNNALDAFDEADFIIEAENNEAENNEAENREVENRNIVHWNIENSGYINCFDVMKVWFSFAKERSCESVVLTKLAKAIKNTDWQIFIDCVQMYYDNRDDTPPALNDMILKESFTEAVHNSYVHIFGARNSPYGKPKGFKKIEYKNDEERLETTIDSVHFVLPRNTDDLYYISSIMHNCVGYYYRNKVLDRKSTIITAQYENPKTGSLSYVACIEIVNNNIVQALGPCNNSIEEKYKNIISDWQRLKNIGSNLRCLDNLDFDFVDI